MSTFLLYHGEEMNKGKLYLVPTLLGECPVEKVMPEHTLEIIRRLNFFIVEEIRTARRFLKKVNDQILIDQITFFIYNEHTGYQDLPGFLRPAETGDDIGLLSEAGTPCIADPGSEIVGLAHRSGISVIPLTGPSSLLLALEASGFNGQNFVFHGYLPVDRILRTKRIKEIEKSVYEKGQTQLFIETPYRNLQLFKAITDTCKDETKLCLAIDLTTGSETIIVKKVHEWRKGNPTIHKRPCVFLLYR